MATKTLSGHGLTAGLAACLSFLPIVSVAGPVTHDTAISWSSAIETFFHAPYPDLSTLSEVVPPLSRLDLDDSAVRASVERVTQQIRTFADRLAPAGAGKFEKAPTPGPSDPDQPTATLEKLEILRTVFGAHLSMEQRARVNETFQACRGQLSEERRARVDARMKGMAEYLKGSPHAVLTEPETPPVGVSSPPPNDSDDLENWHSRSDFTNAVARNYVKGYTEAHRRGDISDRIRKERLPLMVMNRFIEDGLHPLAEASKRTGSLDHAIPLPKGTALGADVLADFLAHVGRLIPTEEGSQTRFGRNGEQTDGIKFYWNYVVMLNPWGEPKIEVDLTEIRRGREYTSLLTWNRSSENEVGVRLHMRPTQQGGMDGLTIWQTIRLSGKKLTLLPVDVSWPLSSSAEYAVVRLRPGFTLHHPAVAKLLEMTARFISEIAGPAAEADPAR